MSLKLLWYVCVEGSYTGCLFLFVYLFLYLDPKEYEFKIVH